ncbi:MAG: hypothetical protein KTR31_20790 [Myxococcales bacterium]|nr:hypothetical protein [Myxococcales bacterium]
MHLVGLILSTWGPAGSSALAGSVEITDVLTRPEDSNGDEWTIQGIVAKGPKRASYTLHAPDGKVLATATPHHRNVLTFRIARRHLTKGRSGRCLSLSLDGNRIPLNRSFGFTSRAWVDLPASSRGEDQIRGRQEFLERERGKLSSRRMEAQLRRDGSRAFEGGQCGDVSTSEEMPDAACDPSSRQAYGVLYCARASGVPQPCETFGAILSTPRAGLGMFDDLWIPREPDACRAPPPTKGPAR